MKTVIILFVFILGARPRKPFQSQLFELSLRQRIGSMVSRTRLNLRRLYFSLCLFLHLFSNFLYKLHTLLRIIDVFHWVYKPFIFKIFFLSNFQIICSRRKKIYTFYLFGGKTERNKVSKQKHWKFKIAMKGIYFFFCVYDNRPWHFLRCRFLSCLVELFLAIFMPLQEFVVYFETGKNLWITFKNGFFVCFWLFKSW